MRLYIETSVISFWYDTHPRNLEKRRAVRRLLLACERVPVERLVKNLEERIRKDPKDAQAVLNLARAHAMAYSLRTEELEVVKKAPDHVWFGYEPSFVPFRKVTLTDDPEKLKAAKVHLTEALKLYGEALRLKPGDLLTELGYAWLLTRTDRTSEAITALRKVLEKAFERDETRQPPRPKAIYVAAEAVDYLIPLLDAEKDKDEISTLKTRAKEVEKYPRPVTPIAVPLRGGLNASDLENHAARVTFDVDGTGIRREWTWITRNGAWLVHDPKGTGKITSGLQLFGNVTFWMFWESGYDALAALDDNPDGQLTGRELEGLALWKDANENGIADPGEVIAVSHFGIVAISCKSTRDLAHPDRIAYSPSGVTFKDGTTRATYDLVLHSR